MRAKKRNLEEKNGKQKWKNVTCTKTHFKNKNYTDIFKKRMQEILDWYNGIAKSTQYVHIVETEIVKCILVR